MDLAGTKFSPGITFESLTFVLVLRKRVGHSRLRYCIREKILAQPVAGIDNLLNHPIVKIRTNHTSTNDTAVKPFRILIETS